MKKKITIFKLTGSGFGESTLDIIRHNPDKYEVIALTANKIMYNLEQGIILFKNRFDKW